VRVTSTTSLLDAGVILEDDDAVEIYYNEELPDSTVFESEVFAWPVEVGNLLEFYIRWATEGQLITKIEFHIV
jgi:hypothetical protein